MEDAKTENNSRSLKYFGYAALVIVSLVAGGRIGGSIGYDLGYEEGFSTAKDTCCKIIKPYGADISDKICNMKIYHPPQQEFNFHLEK